jgi:hypothetical protein
MKTTHLKTSIVRSLIAVSLTALVLPSSLLAAPKALKLKHSMDLSSHAGSTYLSVMQGEESGIKSHFDADFSESYKVANWSRVKKALSNFDKKVTNNVLKSFEDGEDGLKNLVDVLEGQEFTPESIVELLRGEYHGRGNIFALGHFIAMASGAGTMIRVDSENYFYNFGYRDGSADDDVKSGRSYGAGPSHAANDASDIFYLGELQALLESGRDTKKFYSTFLSLLTRTDLTGYETMSDDAQTTETDLIAIYTAELDRHLMVNLNPTQHPWENDLAEATFVSVFNVATGLMEKDGELVEASIRNHWAKSTVSNRSGIGITRQDRRALQVKISSYLRENHADEVATLEALIGKRRDGDLFRGLMEFLNNNDNQDAVTTNAAEISDAFLEILMLTKKDAAKIAEAI